MCRMVRRVKNSLFRVKKATLASEWRANRLVDPSGFEPLTSSMPLRRSTN